MPRDAASIEVDTREADKGGDYYCAACGRLATKPEWAISVNGGHEHVLFNPAGVVFRVLCFADAPGMAPVGEPSFAFTWFKGNAWRIALCRDCGSHLGWRWDGADGAFFGVIKDKVVYK